MVDEPTADTSAVDNQLGDAVHSRSSDELTDDNTKRKWYVANAALGDTGEGAK